VTAISCRYIELLLVSIGLLMLTITKNLLISLQSVTRITEWVDTDVTCHSGPLLVVSCPSSERSVRAASRKIEKSMSDLIIYAMALAKTLPENSQSQNYSVCTLSVKLVI
jgi:hypothetical protein